MSNVNERVRELAAELSSALVHGKRDNGDEFVSLKDNSPAWMTEVIREVHDKGNKLPDDTSYAFIERCADVLAESSDDSEPSEAIYEIEPDIYTHESTAWLNARADHISYLDEMLEEMGFHCKSASDLLMAAQARHIHEVGAALVSALETVAEESPMVSR